MQDRSKLLIAAFASSAFHAVTFAVAFLPIFLGGAFGTWDARTLVYPHATLIADRLFSMNMLWNDLSAFGFPSSVSLGYAFQPLHLLSLLLARDPIIATNVTIVAYMVLAASAATVFLRREGWSPWTSLFGGTAYAFILWSWMYEISVVGVLPLLIITLLAFQHSAARPMMATILATIALSFLWLGSHVHYAVMAFILAWTYLIGCIARGGHVRRHIVVGLIASFASITVAMLRYLPMLALAALSSRSQEFSSWNVDLKLPVFLFFLPRPPMLLPLMTSHFQLIPHMGAFTGACVLLALSQAQRLRHLWPYGAVALLSLLFLMPGVSTIFFAVPPIRLLGSDRWLFIGMVALIPVACAGFDILVHNTAKSAASRIGWMYSMGGIVLLLAVAAKSVWQCDALLEERLFFPSLSMMLAGAAFLTCRFRPALAATIGISSVLLTLFGVMLEWRIPIQHVRGSPQFLPSSSQEIVHAFAPRSAMPQPLSSETTVGYFSTMFYADTNLFHNIAVTASPEPLLSRRAVTILNLLGTEPLRSSPVVTTNSLVRQLRTHGDLLSALGVQWVLSPRSLQEIAALEFRERISIGGEATVYRYAVRGSKPPAYVLPAVSLYEPGANDIAMRLLQNYQQTRTVVECPGCSGRHDSSGFGSFAVQEWSPTSVRIDVVTPDDQWMAVRQAALPGIKVTIDGQPAPFAFAHGIIVALIVPQGNHTVTVSHSYLQLLKDSLQILFGGSCLWCTPS